MRKILLIIIIILILALGYVSLAKGLYIGPFHILSLKQVKEESENLKAKIEEANIQIDSKYPQSIKEVKDAAKAMQAAKNEYLEYTNLSSDKDILEARTQKSYAIEFLWAKLGTHARREGINLKLEIVSSSTGANNVNDLQFTVDGSYIAITNFIYAIENDSDLDFRIQNFKLLPNNGNILKGTFKVLNVGIQGNDSSISTTENENQNAQQNNSKQNNSQTNSIQTNTIQI